MWSLRWRIEDWWEKYFAKRLKWKRHFDWSVEPTTHLIICKRRMIKRRLPRTKIGSKWVMSRRTEKWKRHVEWVVSKASAWTVDGLDVEYKIQSQSSWSIDIIYKSVKFVSASENTSHLNLERNKYDAMSVLSKCGRWIFSEVLRELSYSVFRWAHS